MPWKFIPCGRLPFKKRWFALAAASARYWLGIPTLTSGTGEYCQVARAKYPQVANSIGKPWNLRSCGNLHPSGGFQRLGGSIDNRR